MAAWLNHLEKQVVDRLSLAQYCRLVNVSNAMVGRRHRIGPHPESGLHRVTIGSEEIVICRRARHRRYKRGVGAFVDKLAAEYGLNRLPSLEGGLFIDCGANVGELGLWARRQGMDYVAFEPEPLEADCIDINVFGGQPLTRRQALWCRAEELTFYSAPDTADSSLFDIDTAVRTRKVEAIPLDEAGLDLSQGGPKVLKLEAEGAEPEILDGASKVLPKLDYVAVDCGYERGRERRHTFIDVCDRLLPLGFRPIEANLRRITILFENTSRA